MDGVHHLEFHQTGLYIRHHGGRRLKPLGWHERRRGFRNHGRSFDLSFAYAQWNLNIFHSFIFSDGASPLTSLTADSSGNLYGTTNLGGDYDLGAVFKMTPHGNGDWQESTIYSFQYGSANGVNGVFPSSLILDGIGNVYGATAYGGPINRAYGSVFEVSPTSKGGWSEKDLIRFSGVIDHPLGNLISDKFGNLYGTTLDGGASAFGSVYELSPQANGTWTQTVITASMDIPMTERIQALAWSWMVVAISTAPRREAVTRIAWE